MKRSILTIAALLLCLMLPAQEQAPDTLAARMPTPWYYYGPWLHKGLNVSLDLSVFASFGHNVPHRGGFSQNLSATYLTPLSKDNRLWMAAGGYVNNTTWGGDSYRDGGLYAMIGYKFNDRWEAYVYGQKSVANNYSSLYNRYWGYGPYLPGMAPIMGRPLGYGMGAAGADVIGAAVKYNFNPNFSIQVSVEGVWPQNGRREFFDHHDNPVIKE
ncbi:MAG: hypothetical protein SOY49_05880 [Prevotella sp.]|nr:hypothetical protein [Prevotella sp.]